LKLGPLQTAIVPILGSKVTMLSPRLVQALFTAVALVFSLTLISRALTGEEADYSAHDGAVTGQAQTPKAASYLSGSGLIASVSEKVSPWLGGNSMARHIRENELAYAEMLQQRKEMYKDYAKLPDPTAKSLYDYTYLKALG
jgi:hypothetical protein